MPKKLLLLFLLMISFTCVADSLGEIPVGFRGQWFDGTGDNNLTVTANSIFVSGASRHTCKAEKIYSAKSGFFSSSYGLSVSCDAKSTQAAQRYASSLGIVTPDKYRKNYIFVMDEDSADVQVKHTMYISKGSPDSEGEYTFTLGYFTKK